MNSSSWNLVLVDLWNSVSGYLRFDSHTPVAEDLCWTFGSQWSSENSTIRVRSLNPHRSHVQWIRIIQDQTWSGDIPVWPVFGVFPVAIWDTSSKRQLSFCPLSHCPRHKFLCACFNHAGRAHYGSHIGDCWVRLALPLSVPSLPLLFTAVWSLTNCSHCCGDSDSHWTICCGMSDYCCFLFNNFCHQLWVH